MRDSGSLAAQVIARADRAVRSGAGRTLSGTVTAIDSSGNVTVNVAGAILTGLIMLSAPVRVGDQVTITAQGGTYRIIGPAVTKVLPSSGTVTAVPSNSSVITVSTSLGSLSLPWNAAYTPTVADVVRILWLDSQTGWVLGKDGKTGTPTDGGSPGGGEAVAPPPAPTITTGTITVPASSSAYYLGSKWYSGDVRQGTLPIAPSSPYTGAWFYNGKVRASLAGATVTRAQIWLNLMANLTTTGAAAVHLIRVANNTRPGGALTFDTGNTYDASLKEGQSGWFDIPITFAQALVDAGGSIGIHNNPGLVLAGLDTSGSAGALKITWQRSS